MSAPSVYAIDFGTTNSLVAAANSERSWPPLAIDPGASDPTVLRSVLFFDDDSGEVFCGAEALRRCVESGMRGRLVRSIKRFLPSPSFSETRIGRRRYSLEDLVAIVLRSMRERANRALAADVRDLVLGCPARFSDDDASDRLARERLLRAAELAGFQRVSLCEEPVAATLDVVRTRDELVAVVDLGGGTSDFTVARLTPARPEILAVGGIAVAGDALDGAIMREQIAPYFGTRSTYRMPFGETVLNFPRPLLEKLCSPAELSLLDRREVLEFLKTIRSFSLGPDDRERLDRLLCLIEDRLGFQIFEAIDQTKRALSSAERAVFDFAYPTIELRAEIARSDFERAARPSVDRIIERFEQTVTRAGISLGQLQSVYLTGGTARVPAVLNELAARVGSERLHHASTFHSVIQGLAERARQRAGEESTSRVDA